MKKTPLVVILVLAAILRLGMLAAVWDHRDRVFTPDSESYWTLTQQLLENHQFQADGRAAIFRTPGYPAFLVPWMAASHAVTGAYDWHVVLVTQIILDVLLVYLTYLLGRMLAGELVGWFAAAFAAVSPLMAAASCRILSDGLYALLLMTAILLLVRHLRLARAGAGTESSGKTEWWSLVCSALAMGMACYVRPVGLAFSAVFVLVLLAGRRWVRAGVFAAVVAACVLPWVARNAAVADYRGFSDFATDSMYHFSAPLVVAKVQGISVQEAREQRDADYQKALDANGGAMGVGQLARYRADYSWRVIAAHPWVYAGIHLKGDLAFWLPDAPDVLEMTGLAKPGRGILETLHTQGLLMAARQYFGGNVAAALVAGPLIGLFLIKLVGLAACVIRAKWRALSPEVWLMVLLVVVSSLLAGPAALPRFRIPVEPILSIAAGAGWLAIQSALQKKQELQQQ